ncbi:hypothetical protein FRC09_003945, partial [Ceratobasidium sp. 395]
PTTERRRPRRPTPKLELGPSCPIWLRLPILALEPDFRFDFPGLDFWPPCPTSA